MSSSTGRSRNPEKQAKNEYIPHFIAKKPFYIDDDTEGDYLEHQRLQNKKTDDLASAKWYDNRGKRAGPAATKYRKGACENCGAITHKTKECLSRPRKLGARWTGQDIQPDEIIEEVQLGWDGKRDRWNGYDPREHQRVVEEHARMEELRKLNSDKAKADAEGEGEDEDKYAEETEMPGQAYDAASRISTRNLRIREDTAKYLLNLDLDSAKYDPKTRTMVDQGATSDQAAALVAEDNFMRSSGDAAEFERLQRLAWESRERGDRAKMHLQANPTEAEHIRKKQERETTEKRARERKALLDKYGGAEHFAAKPPVLEEEERYIEYTPTGQVKGKEKITPKSKYPEDKYIGNHTSVWGSWWENFKWGYACCHSTVKKSYCTGKEGIKASEEANRMRLGLAVPDPRKQIEPAQEKEVQEVLEVREKREKEDKKKAAVEEDDEKGKRKFEEISHGVTEEDMEAYRRQKRLHDDPMANFVDTV
ncbi:mRNA splicing protein [Rhizina undulata]